MPGTITGRPEDVQCALEIEPPLSVVSGDNESLPTVSALICTRNRGDSIVATVRSILHRDSVCRELIVIDQSSDGRTEQALLPFAADRRLRYIRTETEGKGLALNMGLSQAASELVAITDDDCEVPPEWPKALVAGMAADPRIAIAYGTVTAAEHDASAGFIPAYDAIGERTCSTVWQKFKVRGIGANTVVRREAVLRIGGFDNEVGPGGKFRACIDRDMTVRCLLAGYSVYESGASSVLHFGFRNWQQGRKLTYDSFYGMGASFAKPVRCGRLSALPRAGYEFGANALLPFLAAVIANRRPAGWLRVSGFVNGFIEGWRTPMDRTRLLYATKPETGA